MTREYMPERPFKYTGQEEDKETRLLYYKARYYDPMLGRFLQADSEVFPERTFGMNRYAYVEGRPVNYRDPSGNKPAKTALFAIAIYFHRDAIAQSGVNPLHAFAAGMYALRGGTNPGKDTAAGLKLGDYKNYTWGNAAGGLRWASGGLKRAADTFNQATGQDYEVRKRINVAKTCGVGGVAGALTTGPSLAYSFGQGAAGSAGSSLGVIGFGKVALAAAIGCAMYTAGYYLGTEGYGDSGGGLLGNVGFAVDGADSAGLIKGKASAIAAPSVWYQLGIFGYGLSAGDRVYQRNKRHRALVNAFNCIRLADTLSGGEDGNLSSLGALGCRLLLDSN